MKVKIALPLIALVLLALACNLVGAEAAPTQEPLPTETPPQSEKRCGDGVCDGPENVNNCPQDCKEVSDTGEADEPETDQGGGGASNGGILYHIIKHSVTSNEMSGTKCYMFNFREFLDGGYVQPDGSGNEILELKDHPTSVVTSKRYDRYYYISSPNYPVMDQFGIGIFNWDVEGQTLWAAGFEGGASKEIAASSGGEFPGGVATAPGNRYLLYPMTKRSAAGEGQAGGFMPGKSNPFLSDSSLVIVGPNGDGLTGVLSGTYNRQLFDSFADFSPDGESFYTIAREGQGFKFVKIGLGSGAVSDFAEVFPGFDWGLLNWDEFFPPADDFSYANFTISPDEKRLLAYKNIFTAHLDNPCFSAATHNLWLLNLETGVIERFENRDGYVSEADWKGDSSAFALAVIGSSGCYPDYLDSWIEILDRDGRNESTLVEEPKSKITTMAWSPDDMTIVYDVYGTDFVGRLKLVDVAGANVREIIDTQTLGYEASRTEPVTLLFADWVAEK
jgi:hypothetical protein